MKVVLRFGAALLFFGITRQPFRQPAHFAGAINAGDGGGGLGQNVAAAVDFVFVLDAGPFGLDGGGSERQYIIEERRQKILHIHLRHHQHHASRFQLAVAVPHRPQQLDAAELEPGEVVGVVYPSLAVGFLIADADFDLVGCEHADNVGGKTILGHGWNTDET